MTRALWVVLVACAACDLQPQGRAAPAKAAPTVAVPVAAAPPIAIREPVITTLGAGSGSASAPASSQACIEIAVHVADLAIAAEADAVERGRLIAQRTSLIHDNAVNCTHEAWSDGKRACYTAATTFAGTVPCEAIDAKPAAPAHAHKPVMHG
jgi:hypothetical protein